jgi:hypothetical protein
LTLGNKGIEFPVACDACNLGQAPEEIRSALVEDLLVDWHRRAWESGSSGATAERFVDQNSEVRREIGMNGSDGPSRAKPGEERFVIIRTGIYLPEHEKNQQEFWYLPPVC